MPTPAENLDTAIANYASTLATISASPKPTYTVGDQSFSWTEYQKFLTEQITALQKAKQATSGPFIVRAVGRA